MRVHKKNYNIEIKVDENGNYESANVTDEHGLEIYKEEWKEISKLVTKDFVVYPDELKHLDNINKIARMLNKHNK